MESSKRRTRGDRVFDAALMALLSLVFFIVAYPLYFIVISSISDPIAVSQGRVLYAPIGFTLDGYHAVFKEQTVMRGYANSLIYTVVGVAINVACTIPTGYAISRRDFFARGPITVFYLVTMFVSGGMMPTYLVVKATGLMNSMWALVVPGAITVWNLLVCRTFFAANIPDELLDAARLDGCGNTRFFFPLTSMIVVSIVLTVLVNLFFRR